jgi:hypothetical protein
MVPFRKKSYPKILPLITKIVRWFKWSLYLPVFWKIYVASLKHWRYIEKIIHLKTACHYYLFYMGFERHEQFFQLCHGRKKLHFHEMMMMMSTFIVKQTKCLLYLWNMTKQNVYFISEIWPNKMFTLSLKSDQTKCLLYLWNLTNNYHTITTTTTLIHLRSQEWVICSFTPTRQFFSYIMARTS